MTATPGRYPRNFLYVGFASYFSVSMNWWSKSTSYPGDVNYVLTSPTFDKVTIHLDERFYPKGKLVIESKHDTPESVYVQEVTVGDRKLKGVTLSHDRLVNAGTLRFRLKDKH